MVLGQGIGAQATGSPGLAWSIFGKRKGWGAGEEYRLGGKPGETASQRGDRKGYNVRNLSKKRQLNTGNLLAFFLVWNKC